MNSEPVAGNEDFKARLTTAIEPLSTNPDDIVAAVVEMTTRFILEQATLYESDARLLRRGGRGGLALYAYEVPAAQAFALTELAALINPDEATT